MDEDKINDELKSEQEYQEVKEWEESDPEDEFDIWKVKKIINERVIIGVVVSVLLSLAIIKFI